MKTLSLQKMENVEGGRRFLGITSCGWSIIGTVAVTGIAAFATAGLGGFLVGKFVGTAAIISSCGNYDWDP